MTKKSENGLATKQSEAKKAWAKPAFQKIEVAARISAASILRLDPTGTDAPS